MSKHSDNITIAIPVYERYDYFEEAINSAINQTVSARISVIDNHSSHSKFKDYVSNLNNPRIKYYQNDTNVGMTGNWNKCIELCETEWVTLLHDDDWLHPQFIEATVKLIDNWADVGCVTVYCAPGSTVDDNLAKPLDLHFNPLYIDNFAYMSLASLSLFPGVTFKKSIGIKVNGFDNATYPIADYDFWVKLVAETKTAIIPLFLALYRVSPQQATSSASGQIIKTLYQLRSKLLYDQPLLIKFFSRYDTLRLCHFYVSSKLLSSAEEINDKDAYAAYKRYSIIFNNKVLLKVFNKLHHLFKHSLLKNL